jgi:acyl carrier protein
MTITESDIRNAIRSAAPLFDVDSLANDKDFFAAGLASLDHAMVLLRLLERHGLDVPDEQIAQCGSIHGILEYEAKQSE